jgi:peptidoglycan/xylan/chitin deacetylase (PgdA/CDA1 family)
VLRSWVAASLRLLPLRLHEALTPRRAIVLLYHAVGPPLPHVRHLYPHKSAAEFEADLAHLARRYRMVSCDDLGDGAGVGRGRPAAHVTFDDGYRECATIAAPILRRMGIPCTFFVTTDFVDNRVLFHRNKVSLCVEAIAAMPEPRATAFLREQAVRSGVAAMDRRAFAAWLLGLPPSSEPEIDRVCAALGVDVRRHLEENTPYLTTGDIRDLAAAGFTIGAHGRRHLSIGSLDEAAARAEILESCAAVGSMTGADRVPFAFPHSADGVDRGFLARLRAGSPRVGLLFDTRQLRQDAPFIVNRLTVDAPPERPGTSNLGRGIRDAYVAELIARLRR